MSNNKKTDEIASEIITATRKFDHIASVLKVLSWPPRSSILMYAVGILAFKCVKEARKVFNSRRDWF